MAWLRLFLFIGCFIGFANKALACTCYSSFEETTESANLIFLGIAKNIKIQVESKSSTATRNTEFEVVKLFKGWAPEKVVVSTDTGTCGMFFKLHKLQMVVARGHSYRSLYTDGCFQYGTLSDYVNYFENPLSQFEETLSKLEENGKWQTCFFKFKEAYERKPVGKKFYVDDPVCEKYQRFYDKYFHTPQLEDYGLTQEQ